jgi:hypothetical protein
MTWRPTASNLKSSSNKGTTALLRYCLEQLQTSHEFPALFITLLEDEALRRLIDSSFGLCLVGDVQLHKCDVILRHAAVGIAQSLEISARRHDAVARA